MFAVRNLLRIGRSLSYVSRQNMSSIYLQNQLSQFRMWNSSMSGNLVLMNLRELLEKCGTENNVDEEIMSNTLTQFNNIAIGILQSKGSALQQYLINTFLSYNADCKVVQSNTKIPYYKSQE